MHTLFFDFDSTLITKETLELLAEVALQENLQKENLLKEIEDLTNKGMNGEISLEESLQKRFALINLHKKHVEKVSENILEFLSPSAKKVLDFFKNNSQNIYIVSGGFRECILPICKFLGLNKENIFANEFIYDNQGNILGIDMSLPTAQKGGKLKIIKNLKNKNKEKNITVMVGDGSSDLETKTIDGADIFVAFTETVYRERVVNQADFEAKNMLELLGILKNNFKL